MTEKDTEDNNFAVVTRIEDHDFNNYVSNRFPYRIGDVANMLTHPRVNGKNKLFRFLREQNIFKENVPLLKYKDLGYFMVDYRFHVIGNVNCPITWVSIEGVEFIKNLITEVLGENFIGTPKLSGRRPGKLTNLNTLLK